MTNLDSILKSRQITLPTKVCLVKAMVFPVVTYGCESWTVKKAECRKIDAFELWCWRRLLRVLWTARRSNQSILKEISPGCSLEGLMLKLKLQYFGHLMRRVDSLEKTLMLGRIEGRRRRGRQRMRWLDGITDSMLRFMGLQRIGQDWVTELNWWVVLVYTRSAFSTPVAFSQQLLSFRDSLNKPLTSILRGSPALHLCGVYSEFWRAALALKTGCFQRSWLVQQFSFEELSLAPGTFQETLIFIRFRLSALSLLVAHKQMKAWQSFSSAYLHTLLALSSSILDLFQTL